MKEKYESPIMEPIGSPFDTGTVAAAAVPVLILVAVWDAVVVWNYGAGVNVGAAINFGVTTSVTMS